jgi:hypothetical protein
MGCNSHCLTARTQSMGLRNDGNCPLSWRDVPVFFHCMNYAHDHFPADYQLVWPPKKLNSTAVSGFF